MSVKVKLYCNASRCLELVQLQRDLGLVQGKEFDFMFVPSSMDDNTFDEHQPQHAIFEFYDTKYASLFILKVPQCITL